MNTSVAGELNREVFDYERMVWGHNDVRTSRTYLGALRLRYALAELEAISGKVLEIGCGGGGMMRAIKHYRPDLDIYGCDISVRTLAMGEMEFPVKHTAAADALALPYRSGEFHAVLMFDVLEHLECPEDSVEEATRLLDRGGLLHASVPLEGGIETLQGIIRKSGWDAFERTVGHIQAFEIADLRNLLASQGLGNLKVRWSGHAISQIAHSAYVVWLAIRNHTNPSMSVESYLSNPEPKLSHQILGAIKSTLATATFYESRILRNTPGAIAHVTGTK